MGLGYADSNKNNADKYKIDQKGMKWDRSCTDILCCLVFTAFIFGMVVVSAVALSAGDPLKIFTPFDSDGNMCGMPDQTQSNSTDNVKRDFTDYKFKYFTGLENIAEGSNSFDNAALYNAVCVKECPQDVPFADMASDKKQDCMVNDDVPECPGYASIFINTTNLYGYCMPDTEDSNSAVQEILKQMTEQVGFANYINDIKQAWVVLVIMAFVTLIVTLVYIWLLKCITKPLLYTSLVLIFVLGVATGYYAYKKTMEIEDTTSNEYKIAVGGSVIIWIIVVLYMLFLCCFWRAIQLGASIMETSSEFVTENKKIVLLPLLAYLFCLPVIAWWTITSVYIYSMGTPTYEEKSFIATIEGTQQSDYMFVYFLFGLFWVIAFVIAVQVFTTSATTCMWYFTGHGSDDTSMQGTYSVWMALKWAFRYHIGSIAFGAFLVAVITMLRVILEYIIYQYEKANPGDNENCIWKCFKCCSRCVLKCLDCCVKYINKNAYIQIALHNSNFCTAAKESFYLNIRHASRFSAVSMVGSIMSLLGKGTVVAVCAFLTIALIDAQFSDTVKQPYLAAAIVAMFAYLVASVFLSIFRDSALTILHCFCLDEEQGGSRATPKSLQPFIDMAEEKAKKDEGNQIQPNSVE